MIFISFFKSLFCKNFINEKNKLLREIEISNLLINTLKQNSQKLIDENDKLNNINKSANYWNNKFPKSNVTYPARDNNMNVRYDVRNFIYTKSFILENSEIYKSLLKIEDDDEKALSVLRWVGSNIKYIGDFQSSKLMEYWQDPELTIQLKYGDCEDGAILIASLLRCLNIPAYKIKVCASWVQDPDNSNKQVGHAYCIYLDKNEKWRILDWCFYFGESIINFNNLEHKQNNKYKQIWFTFNDEFIWKEDDKQLE
jgi:predicted transglutaminase-like cysteine proteinase